MTFDDGWHDHYVKPVKLDSRFDDDEEVNPWKPEEETTKHDLYRFESVAAPPSKFDTIGKRTSSLEQPFEPSKGMVEEEPVDHPTPIHSVDNGNETPIDNVNTHMQQLVAQAMYNQETLQALISKVEKAKKGYVKQLEENNVLIRYIQNAQEATNHPRLLS